MNFDEYKKPAVAADIVLFRIINENIGERKEDKKQLQVAMIKREIQEVETGKWAIPGAFVDIDKTIEETIYTKIAEKIGSDKFATMQLCAVDNIARDNRWRVISIAHVGIVTPLWVPENYKCEWFDINGDTLTATVNGEKISLSLKDGNGFAFDHCEIIKKALEWLKGSLYYSDFVFNFLPQQFTIRELKAVFEAILGKNIDNFARRMSGMLKETGEIYKGKACRPAKVYERIGADNNE